LKIKLDENLGHRVEQLLGTAGHDVATVHDEDLCSASDERVIGAAREEQRCLVTLDLEFGNPLRFRPADYAGIAVLRLPAKPSYSDLEAAVRTLLAKLDPSIRRRLWIVEAGRIRVYQAIDDDPLDAD